MVGHLAGLVAVVALIVSAQATPVVRSTVNTAHPGVLFKASKSINDCGDSTFVNESSRGSPTVADCLKIASNIAGGGTWEVAVAQQDQHKLVQYGTCAFGVQADGGDGGLEFYVGNQDIIDLIHSSINKFQWNGLVGAKGNMKCQSLPKTINVLWGLYHN